LGNNADPSFQILQLKLKGASLNINPSRIAHDTYARVVLHGGTQLLTAWIKRTVLVFSGIFTFLVDAYPLYAASALAANSFARSSFGGEQLHVLF